MGWSQKRIDAYRHGNSPTWIELLWLEHANPLFLTITILAGALFIYGTWRHDWTMILSAMVLGLYGHIHCWLQK